MSGASISVHSHAWVAAMSREPSVPTPGPTPTANDELAGWTDLALVDGVVVRSEAAYAELYRRHSRSVSAASKAILGRGPEYEDVVAEVFVAFWLGPSSFDPSRGSILGFLRLKAKGKSIDLVRSTVSRRKRELCAAGDPREPVAEHDTTLVNSEESDQLRRAVGLLPLGEREVIQLAFFVGLTYLAVAHELGIPEGTVKSRIRRGLHHLSVTADLHLGSDPPRYAPTTD